MGEFTFDGKITGKSKIDSGVGEIKVNLIDKKEDYTIDISKGIGTITLDGEKVEDNKKYENGDNFLEINGGIGNINIKFGK